MRRRKRRSRRKGSAGLRKEDEEGETAALTHVADETVFFFFSRESLMKTFCLRTICLAFITSAHICMLPISAAIKTFITAEVNTLFFPHHCTPLILPCGSGLHAYSLFN